MKLTEDGHMVADMDMVYEIVYNWLNAEISLAETMAVNARDTKGKVWKDIVKCERQCRIVNAENKYVPLDDPLPTVKMFTEWE